MVLYNPFLGYGSVNTHTNTTIQLLLEMFFSTQSIQSGAKEDSWSNPIENQPTKNLILYFKGCSHFNVVVLSTSFSLMFLVL